MITRNRLAISLISIVAALSLAWNLSLDQENNRVQSPDRGIATPDIYGSYSRTIRHQTQFEAIELPVEIYRSAPETKDAKTSGAAEGSGQSLQAERILRHLPQEILALQQLALRPATPLQSQRTSQPEQQAATNPAAPAIPKNYYRNFRPLFSPSLADSHMPQAIPTCEIEWGNNLVLSGGDHLKVAWFRRDSYLIH